MFEFHDMPGHLIRRLHQISISIFSEKAAAAGLDITSVQFAALTVIQNQSGIDQTTLASLIAYDRVTIGGVVDRLVHKKLISRQTSQRDRRARELVASEKGRAALAEIEPLVHETQDKTLEGLGEEERGEFLRLLKKATTAGNMHSRAPLKAGYCSAVNFGG